MKNFRVFGKNTNEWLDQKDTFSGYTLCLTEDGSILATKIGQKDFMLLDPTVYDVCFNTYLKDSEGKSIFENDVLFDHDSGNYFHIYKEQETQGFIVQRIDFKKEIGLFYYAHHVSLFASEDFPKRFINLGNINIVVKKEFGIENLSSK